jgi:hypothetical protein
MPLPESNEPLIGPPEPGRNVTLPRLPSSEVTTPGEADQE